MMSVRAEFGGRMSDLCNYELEDNVWDEFGESDDHIVPHPGDEQRDQCSFQSDSHKKPRREEVGFTNNAHDALSKYVIHDERTSPIPKKDTILENGHSSQTPNAVLNVRCDSNEIISIASDSTRTTGDCLKSGNVDSVGSEFCIDDPVSIDRSAAVDNNLNLYPLDHISQSDKDISFFDSNQDEEGSNLLYYGWLDIGNFEDVDTMFRNCDSTFGLGSLSNENDLPWFSSSDPTGSSEDALKSGFKYVYSDSIELKTASENHDTSRLNSTIRALDDSNQTSIFVGEKVSSLTADADEAATLGDMSLVNASDRRSRHKNKSRAKDQINMYKKQSKHQNHLEGKIKGQCLQNDGFFHHHGTREQCTDARQLSGDSFLRTSSLSGIEQRNQNVGPDSTCYMHTPIPYMNMAYGHTSDKNSVHSTLSSTKSEDSGNLSPTCKKSSHESNQAQSMKLSHSLSFKMPAVRKNEKRERLYHREDLPTKFPSSFNHANEETSTALSNPVSVPEQMHLSENEIEVPTEVEGDSTRIPAELDSSNAQESSSMSSVLDETSLESSNFFPASASHGTVGYQDKAVYTG